jgi:5'-3' exonuclease
MAQLKIRGGEVNEDMLRHMILNSVRSYQKKYASEYGEIVLCNDSSHNWRKDLYPYYKANRKKSRDNDDRDWGLIFETLNTVKQEIKDNFPYHFLSVPKSEADDIIAVMTKHYHTEGKLLIISGDKDFQQLQKYPNVVQYSPNVNKFVKPDCPHEFLREHILKGDKSDGIPNILSSDDCLDEGIRQTPLRKKMMEEFMETEFDNQHKYYRNYLRNKQLIDLDCIPEYIEEQVLEEYKLSEPKKGKVFNYLVEHRLNDLMDNIGDFSL